MKVLAILVAEDGRTLPSKCHKAPMKTSLERSNSEKD